MSEPIQHCFYGPPILAKLWPALASSTADVGLASPAPQTIRAVIEAAAGTGKTFALEHIFVHLILSGVPVPAILVVTFTNKATQELRQRTAALVQRVLDGHQQPIAQGTAMPLTPAHLALLQRAVRDLDQAPIYTIHGFCQRALTEFAVIADQTLKPELSPRETIVTLAIQQNLRQAWSADPARQALVQEWMAHKDAKDLWRFLEKLLKLGSARFLHQAENSMAKAVPLATELQATDWKAVANCLKDSSIHGSDLKTMLKGTDTVQAWSTASSEPRFSACEFVTTVRTTKLAQLYSQRYRDKPKKGEEPYPQCLRERFPLLEGLLEQVRALPELSPLEFATADLLLPDVRRTMDELKIQNGWMDFDDLISRLCQAVDQHPELIAALRRRFSLALVDECQDTDTEQWQIFKRLFLDSADHGLILVGDPKQAIYAFRGADVFAYLAARQAMIQSQAQPHPLDTNFRSTPDMVQALHSLFTTAESALANHGSEAHADLFGPEIAYRAVACGAPTRKALLSSTPLAPVVILKLDALQTKAYEWQSERGKIKHPF